MKKILVSVLPLFFFIGCSGYVTRYFYNYESLNGSSNSSVAKDELNAGYNQFYEDDQIKLYSDCEPYQIRIYLINKTDNPINIIWDSVRIHSDFLKHNLVAITRYNKPQDTSEILPNQSLMDEIQFNRSEYLLPYQLSNKDSLMAKSNRVIGEKIELLLPIKIKDKIKEYSFNYTVKAFQLLSIQ